MAHLIFQSGRPDSNRRRPAWEAGKSGNRSEEVALPTRLDIKDQRSKHKNARPNRIEIRGPVAVLFLTRKNGQILECLLDTADLHIVLSHRRCWCAWSHDGGKTFYARSGRRTYLHRLILGAHPGSIVDHKNHNGLDNRRANLRIVTHAINILNRRGATKASKSGLRGVFWAKQNQKWQAKIMVNRKQIHLGFFLSKEEASSVVEEKIRSILEEACHA